MAPLAPPGYAYDLDLLHRAVSAALNTPNWGGTLSRGVSHSVAKRAGASASLAFP